MAMRYFGLLLLVSGCGSSTSGLAQTCCPSGRANQYPSGCVTAGANPRACSPISRTGPARSSGASSGGQQTYVTTPALPPPPCSFVHLSKDDMTAQCVNDLSANAQFLGCLFEDAAGKAEDQRTGLSCPAREAALANQCRGLCSQY